VYEKVSKKSRAISLSMAEEKQKNGMLSVRVLLKQITVLLNEAARFVTALFIFINGPFLCPN
jgi:hypothetical protein